MNNNEHIDYTDTLAFIAITIIAFFFMVLILGLKINESINQLNHYNTNVITSTIPQAKYNYPACAWWCKGESSEYVKGDKEQMLEMCAHNCHLNEAKP